MRPNYSEKFKQGIVKRVLSLGGPSIMEISREIGVNHTSVRKWIKKYGNNNEGMKKNKNDLSVEEKFQILIETGSMSENELGEYLRKKGLHSNQLEEWKQIFFSAYKSVGRPRKDPEVYELRKDKKILQKELRRKEKALAELSARHVLVKKTQEIWGETGDDE